MKLGVRGDLVKAIHFKCGLGANGRPLGLSAIDKPATRFRSCCWDVTEEEARQLVGGWIYLHETKAKPSYFGGVVYAFEAVRVEDAAHQDRIAFMFEAKPHGKGQNWRGADHAMAHQSEVIDTTFPHER